MVIEAVSADDEEALSNFHPKVDIFPVSTSIFCLEGEKTTTGYCRNDRNDNSLY